MQWLFLESHRPKTQRFGRNGEKQELPGVGRSGGLKGGSFREASYTSSVLWCVQEPG
jgi:hypothetical protein